MAFTNDDILVLAKAGFSAQQIAALSVVGSVAPTVDTTVPTAPIEQAFTAQQSSAPQPTTPAPQGATPDDILKAINGLQTQFTQGLIQTTQQPTPATAESILAEIINPPLKTTN